MPPENNPLPNPDNQPLFPQQPNETPAPVTSPQPAPTPASLPQMGGVSPASNSMPASPIYPPAPTAANQPVNAESEQKDFVIAFLLSWLLGGFGADRFYLGYVKSGIFKLVTLGGLGLWAVIDTLRLAFGNLHDKENIPLKGYDKNKTWVRILALLHVIIVGVVILAIFFTVFLTTKAGVQQKARDVERKTDIKALQSALEQYRATNGDYPTLDQMNSTSFRQSNFSNLSDDTYKDPKGSTDQLSASPQFNQYSYAPAPTDCTNQANNKCVTYSLNASLEAGGYYTQYSNDVIVK